MAYAFYYVLKFLIFRLAPATAVEI